MKSVAVLLGLACAVLIGTTEGAPSCCGIGSSCGNYYGGECCGGLTCQSSTCIAAEFPFPAHGPYGYPYYGYYGGYGYSDNCIGCGCNCQTCKYCYE